MQLPANETDIHPALPVFCSQTLVFALPLIMRALQCEMALPLQRGEGPIGLIVCPSRELARQTYEVITHFTTHLHKSGRYPQLNTLFCIGGIQLGEQLMAMPGGVLHMVVATPGRLLDMLQKKKLTLHNCQYLALDEADRLVDLGFEDDIRTLFDFFTHRRQTVLFSATMPKKIQEFALSALIRPLIVNVGRAGAANLDVIQEVEYVKKESRLVYLLEALQKTAPPVLVFASNQSDVDDIHEYLLLKGVEAVAIHGGKGQDERLRAVDLFKTHAKDVLVATDVASKGLDFADVQHVINYNMPNEIEDYVHRIGRTGRRGRTGVATTFINRECNETILMDLKGLLQEAKQKVPPVLASMEDTRARDGGGGATAGVGCQYCTLLTHMHTRMHSELIWLLRSSIHSLLVLWSPCALLRRRTIAQRAGLPQAGGSESCQEQGSLRLRQHRGKHVAIETLQVTCRYHT